MCRLNFSDKNMMCDYHLHSEFSFDSSEKIEAICEKAVQSGIREIAITDHAEFPVRDSAPWPDFRRRAEVLDFCRTRFGENLIIRSGVEAGQSWHCDCPGKEWSGENLDFVLASVHELDGYPDPRTYAYTPENTSDFIHTYLLQMTAMAEKCDYDVLGHVTYLFRFIPEEIVRAIPPESFMDEYEAFFRTVLSRGKGIEVNCSGLRMPSIGKTLPSLELLRLYRELGGEIVTVGSDGHSCRSAFSGLETGYQVLRDAGFSYAASFEKRIPTFYKI